MRSFLSLLPILLTLTLTVAALPLAGLSSELYRLIPIRAHPLTLQSALDNAVAAKRDLETVATMSDGATTDLFVGGDGNIGAKAGQ
ncbi:MAG: hypothetical protein M1817_004290 [Caeruleum heppii]|nr:MAG: hypothetical protein M1817_004290 [Caeruleum heppii]